MTNLEQLHLFLRFHFALDSEAKRSIWHDCDGGEYTEDRVGDICGFIMDGSMKFTDYECQMLSIVASPSKLVAGQTDAQWAEKMKACSSGDTEAAHADADRLLANLVKELGYNETAAAWQSIDKWYA